MKAGHSSSFFIILFGHIFRNYAFLKYDEDIKMIICITLDKTIEELVPCFPVSKGSTNVVATRVKIVLMRIVVTFGTHFFLLFHWPTTTLLKNLSKNSSTLETFYPTKNVKALIFIFSKRLRS